MEYTFKPVEMRLGLFYYNVGKVTGGKTTLKGNPAYCVRAYEAGSRLPCFTATATTASDGKARFEAIRDGLKKAVKNGNVQQFAQEIAFLLCIM